MPNIFLAGSFFPLLPLLMSLAANFAEVFMHRLWNAQIFHQSEKPLFFFACTFLHFLVLFLQNLCLATAVVVAQLFQRTDQSYSSFLLGVSLILLCLLMNGITSQEKI